MAPWRVRDFHGDDLDAAVRLWDDPVASSEAPAFGLSDVIAAVRSHEPAVAAVLGEELVGVAVAIPHGELDMAAIVEESRLFTPADIEFAARRTTQLAFERVMFEGGKQEVTTSDIRHAISKTRRTLTPELVAEFEQDIQDHARV